MPTLFADKFEVRPARRRSLFAGKPRRRAAVAPTLFAADPIDRAALAALAARSQPRADMQAADMVPVAKSADLHAHGYTVIHWITPGVKASEVLEFVPRLSDLPRVTLFSYADQCELHRAVGAKVVSPGRPILTGGK